MALLFHPSLEFIIYAQIKLATATSNNMDGWISQVNMGQKKPDLWECKACIPLADVIKEKLNILSCTSMC
jgi:hypothetical protein